MDRWKTIAMMSVGFTCGVAYTAACGGAKDAEAADVDELSATVAAQQATIVQLELEIAETLRWEVLEHTCVSDSRYESTGVTADGAVIAAGYRELTSERWRLIGAEPNLRDGEVTVDCSEGGRLWRVTVGYER